MGCPPSDTIVEPFSIFIFLPFIPFSDLFVSFVGDGFISIYYFLLISYSPWLMLKILLSDLRGHSDDLDAFEPGTRFSVRLYSSGQNRW